MFTSESHIGIARYFEQLVKAKGMAQWKARGLATGIPDDAITACKSPTDALRLLAVRFMFDAGAGDPITADLKSREYFISPDTERWLSQ